MIKKTYIIGTICVLFLSFVIYNCTNPLSDEKPEENPPPQNISDGNVAEEAYPGLTGEKREGYIMIGGEPSKVYYSRINNENVLEGDIILNDEEIFADLNSITRACVRSNRYWPEGKIYYKVAGNVHSSRIIYNAIQHWRDKTSLKFYPRTNQPNYIEFVPSSGNSSKVGMKGGKQEVKLSDDATTGIAIHEIGHAVGLWHEHSRADRDGYVVIHWGNIEDGKGHNFKKRNGKHDRDIGRFDFNSIMLYSSYDFSIRDWYNPLHWPIWNKLYTITKLNGQTFEAQRTGLSKRDREGVKYLYSDKRLMTIIYTGTSDENSHHWVGDVDNDGWDDLIINKKGLFTYNMISGKTKQRKQWGRRKVSAGYNEKHWIADFTDDDRIDLLFNKAGSREYRLIMSYGSSSGEYIWGERIAVSVGFDGTHWAGDVNRDGKADLIYNIKGSKAYRVLIGRPSLCDDVHWVTRKYSVGFDGRHWIADVNNDKRIDLIYNRKGTDQYRVLLSKPDGTAEDRYWGKRGANDDVGFNGKHWVMDVNGDHKDDLVYNEKGHHTYPYIRSTGTSGTFGGTWGYRRNGNVDHDGKHWVGDVNGDGRDDLIYQINGTKTYSAMVNNGSMGTDTHWKARHHSIKTRRHLWLMKYKSGSKTKHRLTYLHVTSNGSKLDYRYLSD